jgi:AhpD family alkylhydroperoxidase
MPRSPSTDALEPTSSAEGIEDAEPAPRLAPIEEPEGLRGRAAYWLARRQMGTVITPLKVVNARIPGSFALTYQMHRVETSLSLSAELRFLVKSHVATLNGCASCIDIAKASAMEEGTPRSEVARRYEALSGFRGSDLFTERERAALAYVEAATREKSVPDETFEDVERHFEDTEIAELTWLCAMENYFNLLSRPLRIGSDELCSLQHAG